MATPSPMTALAIIRVKARYQTRPAEPMTMITMARPGCYWPMREMEPGMAPMASIRMGSVVRAPVSAWVRPLIAM